MLDEKHNRPLQCPGCGSSLKEVCAEANYGRYLLLDQCPDCGGIWFDNWELYYLKNGEANRLDPIDSEKLLTLACTVPPLEYSSQSPSSSKQTTSERVSIAIAQDEAFNFYYPDTLDLLRLAGAELVPFSPLHDTMLPEHIAGIYIGGGFPEEYAHRLSANGSMRAALARFLQKDMPCYAECGGLMYLCQAMRTASGEELPMVGAIARQSVMSTEPGGLVIGYREATALRDTLLTRQGEVMRGHEFHYSCLSAPLTQEEATYEFTTRGQVEGFAHGNLLASYLHLSFSGFPVAAQRFVAAAKLWQTHSGEREVCG